MYLVVLFCIIIADARGFDYCEVSGCEKGKHTMCLYPDKVKCEGASQVGLTREQKKAILDRHNELRLLIASGKAPKQPGAANMMKLKWNNELEEIAQRWADNLPCAQIAHDLCRSTQDGQYCGQNAAVTYITKSKPDYIAPVKEAVDMWYEEVALVEPQDIESFERLAVPSGKFIAHYTQLAWATTSEVGCGVVIEDSSKEFIGVVIICNYRPGGNMRGAPSYLQGDACSNCTTGAHCSKRYPGLCSAEDNEYNDIPDGGGSIFNLPLSTVIFITIAISLVAALLGLIYYYKTMLCNMKINI